MNTGPTSTFLGIPLSRIVAFVGPYVAVASGALAAWLLTHLHVLSMFHLTDNQVASAISQLTVFAITAGLTWLGHQKWLTGHQIELAAAVRAASERTPAAVVNGTGPKLKDDLSRAEGTAPTRARRSSTDVRYEINKVRLPAAHLTQPVPRSAVSSRTHAVNASMPSITC